MPIVSPTNKAPVTDEVRNKMKKFWQQYEPTAQSMMLCSAANDVLAEEDRTQVLTTCPNLTGKKILELGAGIGRFTTELVKRAQWVTAVDFMESYIEVNRKSNSHYTNVDFIAADVTTLEIPHKRYDVIFSNWLLMYLCDEELDKIITKMLSWLKDGGHLFIRESCFKPSGDIKRETNPTYYRAPNEYFHKFRTSVITDTRGKEHSFVCLKALSMQTYIRHYGNPYQLGFVLRKMPHAADSYESFQAFLDGQQYTEEGIRRYEFIFGKTYLSTGGQLTTEEFVQQLALKKGDNVLDVGCGIGGSAFHIARLYGAQVHGVDLSSNMISMALQYQGGMEEEVRKSVSFQMSDITKEKFEPNSFDVIYSRDTILHIGDKEELFSNFFTWLKPGGKLMISDYCHGEKEEYSEDFLKYVMQRGYHMMTVGEYGFILEKTGFENVVADDRTGQFIDILQIELKRFQERKEEFLDEFKEQDFDYIVSGWKSKLERCSVGDQAWGFFTATKPIA